jgi:hypothetical protein
MLADGRVANGQAPDWRAGPMTLAAGAMALLAITALATAAEISPPDPGTFRLEVTDDQRISLDAREAPLGAILEELGRRIDARVETGNQADALVDTRFSKLPVTDALKRLGASFVVVGDGADARITRIILIPEGADAGPPAATARDTESGTESPSGASFQFEFDPSNVPEASSEEESDSGR